jgi:hypothetical protein
MDYIYLANNCANSNISVSDIYKTLSHGILYYICYHITEESKYPFVQIMLEKIPFCNNVVQEQFILPSVIVKKDTADVAELIVKKINTDLKKIRCNQDVTVDCYKGIFSDNFNNSYALVDISLINIQCLYLTRSSTTWFALPTEIINIGSICNIPICEDLIDLFVYVMPELGVLYKQNLQETYLLPDVVYTGDTYKKAELNTLFGPSKEFVYYRFFTSFSLAIKEGGWSKMIDAEREFVNNEYGRYIKGAINRYAVFFENPVIYALDEFLEDTYTSEFEEIISEIYETETIIIIENQHEGYDIKPNILVKEFELFQPLSFHCLDNDILGEKYDIKKKSTYMIV